MSSSSTHTSLPQRLNELIRQRRREQGLTQKELAQKIHLSKSALQKIELGTFRPSALTVQALSRELQFDFTSAAQLLHTSHSDGQDALGAAGSAVSTPVFHFGRIPFHTKQLFGRDTPLRQIGGMLTRPQTRLVTLIGPPGVGKTHLAIASAARLIGIPQLNKSVEPPIIAFPDGAFLVELTGAQSAGQILMAVSRAIGLTPEYYGDFQAICATLRTSRCLLMFDNFEHVLDGGNVVSALLANTVEPRILVTSRAALGVSVEQVFPVAPLPMPDPGEVLDSWYNLHKYPSLDMFEQVVRRYAPHFTLNRVNPAGISAIATLCHRVCGLPLAIELVASQWQADNPSEIVEQLSRPDSVMKLPSVWMSDFPDRQQALFATLMWSQSLLSPAAKCALHRLSVCIGPFSLETARALDVSAKSLAELTQHRLLQSLLPDDASNVSADAPCWSMLPAVREFAAMMLAQSGE